MPTSKQNRNHVSFVISFLSLFIDVLKFIFKAWLISSFSTPYIGSRPSKIRPQYRSPDFAYSQKLSKKFSDPFTSLCNRRWCRRSCLRRCYMYGRSLPNSMSISMSRTNPIPRLSPITLNSFSRFSQLSISVSSRL